MSVKSAEKSPYRIYVIQKIKNYNFHWSSKIGISFVLTWIGKVSEIKIHLKWNNKNQWKLRS